MKKLIGLFVVCILLSCATTAHAFYIVDTGAPATPSIQNGFVLNRISNEDFQWLAGQFSLNDSYVINSIEAYFDVSNFAGDVTISVYGDNLGDLNTSDLKFRDAFLMSASQGWYGLLNENFTLAPGTYWVGFEVRDPSTYGGKLAIDLSSPRVPLAHPLAKYYFANQNQPNYGPRTDPFSVRIGGESVVPEPASLSLLGLGLLGLLRKKR